MTTFIDRNYLNRFDRCMLRVSDLMTREPQSIRGDATIREAIAFMADKGATAAPVINEAGRAIGVLSFSDLIRAIREHGIENTTFFNMHASEFMTPFVFFVNLETPIHTVIAELMNCKIHQMYVADDDGVLVGVLSTANLLRDLDRHAEEQCADSCTTAVRDPALC
jgi:CBS-domain-containing membrane protein